MLLKAELAQGHAYGLSLYQQYVQTVGGMGRKVPAWNELTDINVLKAIKEAEEYWLPTGYAADLVVQTYVKEFVGGPAMLKFQNLVGRGKGQILENIRRDLRGAAAAIRGNVNFQEADASCQNLVQEADIELTLDYARAILKAQTGSRAMTAEGIPVMVSPIGNIPAWVRCFMSGNHPQVLEMWGSEARDQFAGQPSLKIYLTRYSYDSRPVMAMPSLNS